MEANRAVAALNMDTLPAQLKELENRQQEYERKKQDCVRRTVELEQQFQMHEDTRRLRTGYPEAVKLVFAMYAIGVAMAQLQPDSLRTYQDPQNRFQFTYPAGFGTPVPGTDNGFRSRTVAIRLSEFSAGVHAGHIILGGEAVLTSETPQLDLQAAGGLYDAITLQIFPEPIANAIRNALPVLTPDKLCDAIGRERHLDPADPRLTGLTAQQRATIAKVDIMGNLNSKVLRCDVVDSTVTFEKEAVLVPAGSSRHIYGSVRFLAAPYSSFQLIRGSGDAPGEALIRQITAVVNSWKRL